MLHNYINYLETCLYFLKVTKDLPKCESNHALRYQNSYLNNFNLIQVI